MDRDAENEYKFFYVPVSNDDIKIQFFQCLLCPKTIRTRRINAHRHYNVYEDHKAFFENKGSERRGNFFRKKKIWMESVPSEVSVSSSSPTSLLKTLTASPSLPSTSSLSYSLPSPRL